MKGTNLMLFGAKTKFGVIKTVHTKTARQAREILEMWIDPEEFPNLFKLWAASEFEVIPVMAIGKKRIPISLDKL